jgi:hypothetical protein
MIMDMHRSKDGTMFELDVWWKGRGLKSQMVTFTRRTQAELEGIVRTITRSKR